MTDNALEAALRSWGRAKRKLNGAPPPKSIFGRISDEGNVGAAIRGKLPDPPEVMLKDALIIARAIRAAIDARTLNYDQNQALHMHYVAWGPISKKIKRLKLKRYEYFSLLNGAKAAVEPFYWSLGSESGEIS